CLDLTASCTQVKGGCTQLSSLRCDPINSSITHRVLHLVPADNGVVPVRDIQGTIGSKQDIARPEPLNGLGIRRGIIPDIAGIVTGKRCDKVDAFSQVVSCTIPLRMIG